MNLIITIIVGAIVGWIASIIMGTNREQGLLWDIIIGVIGSFLGSWIFGSLFGIGSAFLAGTFSIWGIIWGIIGAIILIAIIRAFRGRA